jgi:signal-transduction protein with cAMP-binding, CBS, and nucleotidyltransferase domain
MSTGLVTVERTEPISSMIEKMRTRGIRRVIVLDGKRLASVVSLDDILFDLSTTLFNISEATRRELSEAGREAEMRRRRERREEALEEIRAQLASVAHDARESLAEQIKHLLERLPGRH